MPSALPDIDDPTDFTSNSLRTLDTALRCQICGELYTAPVLLTTCSHTFDSLCLRNHLKEIKKCPQCQVEANEDRIRRNLVVEEAVSAWRLSRPDILSLQRQAESETISNSSPPPIASTSRLPIPSEPHSHVPRASTTTPNRKGKRKVTTDSDTDAKPFVAAKSKSKNQDRTKRNSSADLIIDGEDEGERRGRDASSDVEVMETMSPPTRKRPRKNVGSVDTDVKGKAKAKDTKDADDPTDPSLLVSCPLCSRLVKNGSIVPHLDSQCKKFALPATSLSNGNVTGGSSSSSSSLNGSKGKEENAFSQMMGGGGGGTSGRMTRSGRSDRNDSDEVTDPDTSKYQALPNYAFKKVKDLEKMLKALNLPLTVPSSVTTTESKLKYYRRRHSQYLTFWNSNVDIDQRDTTRHKNPRELRQELREWERVLDEEEKERLRDNAMMTSGRGGRKHHGGKEGGGIGTGERKDEFRSLIEQAKASALRDREKQAKKKAEEEERKAKAKEVVEGEGIGKGDVDTEAETMQVDGEKQEEVNLSERSESTRKEIAPVPANDTSTDGNADDINADNTTEDAESTRQPTPRKRSVRILTPPANLSSSTISPIPSSSSPSNHPASPTPTKVTPRNTSVREEHTQSTEFNEDNSENEDENGMPRPSQRVRAVDWDAVRRAREEEDAAIGASDDED